MTIASHSPSSSRRLRLAGAQEEPRDPIAFRVMPINATQADASVLQRIAAGDENAVREAMDQYGALVWSLAKRMCRNRADAEDAVQDIFVSVWRSAERFDPNAGSEATFVAVIARRKLIDRLRARTRQPDVVALTDAAPGSENTVDRSELSEDARIAAEAFDELSQDQQRVLRLAVHHGCTHEQIATSLNMPLGTVKTHCRRGMIKIRESLQRRMANGAGVGVDG